MIQKEKQRIKTAWTIAFASAVCGFSLSGGCAGEPETELLSISSSSEALTVSQSRVLGFETPTVDWSTTNTGATLSQSSVASQGSAALGVLPNGWTEINSIHLSSLGTANNTATVDVRLPAAVTWGEVRMILIMPSKGMSWKELGSRPLSGLTANTYHTLSFPIDSGTMSSLSGTYSDLTLKVVVNAPRLASPYLLDNIVIAESSPPSDTDSETDTEIDGDPYMMIIKTPHGTTFDQVALGATEQLKIGASVKVESLWLGTSTITSIGTTTGRMVEPDADLGNIWSAGPADIGDRVHIRGSLYAPSATLGNSVVLDGSLVNNAAFEPAEEVSWKITFPNGGDDIIWLEPNQTKTAAPGKYATVRVGPRAILKLQTGTYYIENLTFEATSKLVLDQDKGPVIVYVRNSAVVRSSIASQTGAAPDWLLVYLGSADTNLDKSFSGTVVAPNAKLTLRAVHHYGSFFAKSITVDANAVITHRPGLSILTADDEPVDECTNLVPPRSNLTGAEKEIAYQKDMLRYCVNPELDDCYATLLAKAQVDRTTAALQFVNRIITGSRYLGLCRDRTHKLRLAKNNASYRQSLCNDNDGDEDWVADQNDQCVGTLELYPTDDFGCSIVLPETPDDDTVRDIFNQTTIVFNEACKATEVPGIATPGGFFWRSDPSTVYLVLAKPAGQTPGCSVTYEFELKGETYDNQPAHLYMYFREAEQTYDLVKLGRPVPQGLIQFEATATDSGYKGKLATDIKPYHGQFRARAFNSKGQRGPWSQWKSMTQKDCLSLGFRCANME